MSSTYKALVFSVIFSTTPAIALAADVHSGSVAGPDTSASEWPSFDQADGNNDGFIQQDEASSAPGLGFISSDTDSDGRLNRHEYEAARRGQPVTGGDGGGAPTVSR